jgi:SAM-dependent methyltransferase
MPLVELGLLLRASGYVFVTVTPETHRHANANAPPRARTLRDVFGWSRPFEEHLVPRAMVSLLRDAGALIEAADGMRSAVRFSSLGTHLFVHSAYPTHDANAVFFGPDTYRFCRLIAQRAPRARRAVDVGCGSGAGGIMVRAGAERVVLADVNTAALDLARVNAALAGVDDIEIVESDVLADVEGEIDLVIANPPYMKDGHARAYRDGGGDFGEALSLRIVEESLSRLARGGTLLLYTGAAVVEGRDVFLDAVRPLIERVAKCATFRYEEIDPDVFGEELGQRAYAAVDRIAAVALEVSLE